MTLNIFTNRGYSKSCIIFRQSYLRDLVIESLRFKSLHFVPFQVTARCSVRVLPFGKRVLPSASVSCPGASLVTSFVSCLSATFARGDIENVCIFGTSTEVDCFSTQERIAVLSVQKIFDFLALFFPI